MKWKAMLASTLICAICGLFVTQGFAQHMQDSLLEYQLRFDIRTLAHDSMMGREAGTIGEVKSGEFIAKRFKNIGLQPFQGTYKQNFQIFTWIQYDESSSLTINKKSFRLTKDFYPLSYSSNGNIEAKSVYVNYGIYAPSHNHNDYTDIKPEKLKGKVFIMEMSEPGGFASNKIPAEHTNIHVRLNEAIKRGAVGVIFVSRDKLFVKPFKLLNPRTDTVRIPVVFADNKARKLLFKKRTNTVHLKVKVSRKIKNAFNLIGSIDNKASQTIIIGAHYDHLGWGDFGSRYKGEPAIHNGADDNASGVAAMINLAEFIIDNKINHVNYLFVAFSGEEKGFLGSSYFADHMKLNPEKIKCMINFDMLGRMDSTSRKMYVYGTGSSPEWIRVLESIDNKGLSLSYRQKSTGGSDHRSFYYKTIPVLFFITGLHDDYHTPFDDYEKLNFRAQVDIHYFLRDLSVVLDTLSFLPFSFADENDKHHFNTLSQEKFGIKVALNSEKHGILISKVSDNSPAKAAGLIKGDIITKINGKRLQNFTEYAAFICNSEEEVLFTFTIIRNQNNKEITLTI